MEKSEVSKMIEKKELQDFAMFLNNFFWELPHGEIPQIIKLLVVKQIADESIKEIRKQIPEEAYLSAVEIAENMFKSADKVKVAGSKAEYEKLRQERRDSGK